MKILQSLPELGPSHGSPEIGLTIGNFDGVHLGHRELLKEIRKECDQRGHKFTVVTFVPHPQKILCPEKEHFLICSYEQRRQLLEELGVDFLIEMRFTRDFSTLPPERFLNEHLLSYKGLKQFYLGYDFAFGANKEGHFDLVRSLCAPKGIGVEIQPKFEFHSKTVSSSLIRERIQAGDMEEVEKLLARPLRLQGVVIKGEGRGKKIGFPTANIQVAADVIVPQKGVYITRTNYRGMTYNSVTNIGHNPTFKDTRDLHVETNLFDFDLDIYGEGLEIEFLKKLRDEKKFPTVNDLIAQIKADVVHAKEHLARR